MSAFVKVCEVAELPPQGAVRRVDLDGVPIAIVATEGDYHAIDDTCSHDEVSLAENIERAPLHPLDQFRAFQAMRDKGMTEEAIAAAFFVGVNVVKQRLRLASVSPTLLDVYADDGMTLELLFGLQY